MGNVFTPILVVPAVPHNGGIRFLHRDSQVDIAPGMTEEIWQVLAHCNGHNNIPAIVKLSGLTLSEVEMIIDRLIELEVVVDSKEQYLHFHKICSYPAFFNQNLTQDEVKKHRASVRKPVKKGTIFQFEPTKESALNSVLPRRRSCHRFSGKKLSLAEIGSICHYAYSIKDHAVPSGGALYPLKVYVIVELPQDGMPTGYYEYDAERDELVLFDQAVDAEQLKYCFNQEEMPFGSSVQIIIAADLKRQPGKYANRGYMLTLIEVGHVAENISLFCAEQGLGACELGGIQEEPLCSELDFGEHIYPILAIAVGYSATEKSEDIDKIHYVEEHVGSPNPVESVWVKAFKKDGAFFGATAAYRDKNGHIQCAGATSPAYADAAFKAAIEGHERWLSGQVRTDFYGPAKELGSWINPYDYFPLTQDQAAQCGVEFFTTDLPLSWTLGRKFDGTEVFAPSSIIYYGQKSEKNRIYYGHSSGIAAYSDFAEAEKRALVELIERDALMRNWYAHNSPRIIGDSILSIHAQKRTKHWAKQNRKMFVLEMPSDYGWVFETIIVSSDYPCFISGAAATIDEASIYDAIHKSIQEAEYNLLLCLENPDNLEIDPQKVSSPASHGAVYHRKKYAQKLAWLWRGETTEQFADIKPRDLEALKAELRTITFDLSDSDLFVARVLSPKLVQINFGYNSAHYTYENLKVHPESLKMPHYFA